MGVKHECKQTSEQSKEIMTTDRTFDDIYTGQDVYLSSKRDTHYTI